MIRSWSNQLLIIYILTLYVIYTKIGGCADLDFVWYSIDL